MLNAKKIPESVVLSQVLIEAKSFHKSQPWTFEVQVWESPKPYLQAIEGLLHGTEVENFFWNCRFFVGSYWKESQNEDTFWEHGFFISCIRNDSSTYPKSPEQLMYNSGKPKKIWEQVKDSCAMRKTKIFSVS